MERGLRAAAGFPLLRAVSGFIDAHYSCRPARVATTPPVASARAVRRGVEFQAAPYRPM
ncbi:MAG TPA: hypothetical protein VD835_02680 [Pyrinomonadaceae bacterium]|nr:hypothetical protein [Pyrinomonadaceae bacterium]